MAPPHSLDWLAPSVSAWDGVRQRHAHEGRTGLFKQIRLEVAAVLLRDKMNVLLLLLPLALVSHAVKWPAGATFVLALLPLCSLAERLGMITEQLAGYTNDTLGGLLNATFGNATEVIIAAFAIQRGYLRVVQLTLLGSIISNLLLVMGSAFIAGGLVYPSQTFNQQGINVNCGLLILAVVAVMLPTLLSSTAEAVHDLRAELALSRAESVLMLLCYCLFLVFQLVTHRHLFDGGGGDGPAAAAAVKPPAAYGQADTSCAEEDEEAALPAAAAGGGRSQGGTELELSSIPSRGHAAANGTPRSVQLTSRRVSTPGQQDAAASAWDTVVLHAAPPAGAAAAVPAAGRADSADDTVRLVQQPLSVQVVEEEEEEQVLSWPGCFFWLTLVTVFISILSDHIMDAITDASRQLKVPMPFLTTIVVPIVGNAAEHASALMFAVKNRMEISLGVAVGSSTQVGVLVVPFCVVLAWVMGKPLDLNFNEFEALVLFISVLLAAVVLQDGTSNWLKGAMLVLTYLFIAAGFWVHKDPTLKTGP